MKIIRFKKSGVLFAFLTAGFFILLVANFSEAAEYCVSTETELHEKLTEAQNNDEDDIIRIRIRQEPYIGNFEYNASATEMHSLTIEGGYDHPRCKKRVVANTVLDADGSGRVLELNASNVTADLVVDGLTIENGDVGDFEYGGGLQAKTQGQLTLSRCIITNNTAGSGGGGVFIDQVPLLNISNTTFINNMTPHRGGGIYISGSNIANLSNNRIENNTGRTGGGGFFVEDSNINISESTISYNTGGSGGGGYISNGAINISENLISNNSCSLWGGGIYIEDMRSTVTLAENIISHNNAVERSGGAWIAPVSSVTISSNIITDNTTEGTAGGIATSAQTVTFINNVISHNIALSDFGGGVICAGKSAATIDNLLFINNTVAYNSAYTYGGGVTIGFGYDNDTSDIYNNIIYSNIAGAGKDLWIENNRDGNIVSSTVNLYNNDFDQSSEGTYIQLSFPIDSSNLDNKDPEFATDGYHLTDISPCIDAGLDASIYGVYDDMDGDSRPQPEGGEYDIGADEFIALDLDIARFTATKRVRYLGNKNTVKITLAVVNAGTANSGKTCRANVVGMQDPADPVEVYNETMGVSDQIGKGQSIFEFPDYTPGVVGDIEWTVTIDDDDPDVDEATALTIVN